MPWPMVHFAIAEKMYAITNVSPAFLLGSIAPDAIHTRINCTRKDKGFTHLISEEDQMPSVEIIMENCLRYLNLSFENEWKQFILGYFSHIYADLRWTETVYAEYELMYIGELQEKRKTYNTEVNQIDFNLFHTENWSQAVIHKLKQAKGVTVDPFVTGTEVNQYRDEKLEWLANIGNEPRIVPVYFKEDRIKDFIVQTSKELTGLFKEIQFQIKPYEEENEHGI